MTNLVIWSSPLVCLAIRSGLLTNLSQLHLSFSSNLTFSFLLNFSSSKSIFLFISFETLAHAFKNKKIFSYFQCFHSITFFKKKKKNFFLSISFFLKKILLTSYFFHLYFCYNLLYSFSVSSPLTCYS